MVNVVTKVLYCYRLGPADVSSSSLSGAECDSIDEQPDISERLAATGNKPKVHKAKEEDGKINGPGASFMH